MSDTPNLGPDALAWIKENCSEARDPRDVAIARLSARIAELEGALDTFDRAAFLTEIHAKSFRNGPTSPHFVDVADVYRALEHHAVSAPAVAQAAEFHAIGNPPPEVMALVQEEYKRMAEAKDRTSAQPSGEGAGR